MRPRSTARCRGPCAQSYVGGNSTTPTARNWKNALYLPSLRAGSEMPRRAANERYTETPTSRTAMMMTGHHEKSPRDAEREEPAEHEQLVGERIEERAGAGGAVASREPAVEAVGGREHEPERDGEPRRPVVVG